MRLGAIVIASVISCALCQQPSYKYCPGTDGSNITWTNLLVTPYPIPKGKPVKIEFVGNANVQINQKYLTLNVFQNGSQIFTTNVGGTYIAAAGSTYDYTFTYSIPSFIPPGTYDLQFNVASSTGAGNYACLDTMASF